MSFDHLAPHYRWLEAILAGGLLQRCRTHWLRETRGAKRVLLAGEGNGRMLAACAKALPVAEFTVLDQSTAMLAQARRRWHRTGGRQNVVFQQADLRNWQYAGEKFDLVVTNFFLDCFPPTELGQVVANLSSAAATSAQWLLTDFNLPESGWRRFRARWVLALAYQFFRLATGLAAGRITAPDEALRAQGFVLRDRQHFNHGLLQSDLWERGMEGATRRVTLESE